MDEQMPIGKTVIEEIDNNAKDINESTKETHESNAENKEGIEEHLTNIIADKITEVIDNSKQAVVKKSIILKKENEQINEFTEEVIDQNVEIAKTNRPVDTKQYDESDFNTYNTRPSGILISLPKKSSNAVKSDIRGSNQSGINISFKKSVSRTKNQEEEPSIESAEENKEEQTGKKKKPGRMKKAFLSLRSKINKIF